MIAFTVNGVIVRVAEDEPASLLELLRERLRLTGARYGCGLEQCGACMVLVDGAPVCACTRPAVDLEGAAVTTLEGLGTAHPVQRAFLAEQAAQCAYCLPGIMVSAAALIGRDPDPTPAAIVAALEPHLCRCGAQPRILRAVRLAAALARADAEGDGA